MTDSRVDAFVEAILTDRQPKKFPATPEDRDVLRVAVELRASRSGFDGPAPQFVEELHRRLAATADDGAELLPFPTAGRRGGRERATLLPDFRLRPSRAVRPRFSAVGKAAAAVFLVASTFTATNLVGGHSAAPVAQPAGAAAVHSGALLTSDGRPMGRMYAYSGNPSWVFIDVRGSALTGVYTCMLQLADGTSVPAGLVTVYNGTGDWAHTVKVQASELRQATLVDPAGVTVASATFT
ncbi:MAG TPA: hypothetical protein VMO88_14730 [Acidimicrobiales bacterium]|nr:hypothetical protein [Acidimicrobiales bacterium]